MPEAFENLKKLKSVSDLRQAIKCLEAVDLLADIWKATQEGAVEVTLRLSKSGGQLTFRGQTIPVSTYLTNKVLASLEEEGKKHSKAITDTGLQG